MTSIHQKIRALEFFKDWTNYLLVTTVAAMGWVSAETVKLVSPLLKRLCIWALIPHITEQLIGTDTSIYDVHGTFRLFWLWAINVSSFDSHLLATACVVSLGNLAVWGGNRKG